MNISAGKAGGAASSGARCTAKCWAKGSAGAVSWRLHGVQGKHAAMLAARGQRDGGEDGGSQGALGCNRASLPASASRVVGLDGCLLLGHDALNLLEAKGGGASHERAGRPCSRAVGWNVAATPLFLSSLRQPPPSPPCCCTPTLPPAVAHLGDVIVGQLLHFFLNLSGCERF